MKELLPTLTVAISDVAVTGLLGIVLMAFLSLLLATLTSFTSARGDGPAPDSGILGRDRPAKHLAVAGTGPTRQKALISPSQIL